MPCWLHGHTRQVWQFKFNSRLPRSLPGYHVRKQALATLHADQQAHVKAEYCDNIAPCSLPEISP
jgi:hypothetical protein